MVDGGSTDSTLAVAESFGAEIIVQTGMYGTGLSGARHLGEARSKAELIWNIDADNQLLGTTVATELCRPLLEDPSINIAIPLIRPDPQSSLTNQWLNSLEETALLNIIRKSIRRARYAVVRDLNYGLPNCSILRRSVLSKVAGYDSDVMLLMRLRKAGLSTAAIVSKANFSHNMVDGYPNLARKIVSRVRRFSMMSADELSSYIFTDSSGKSNIGTRSYFARFVLNSFLTSIRQWLSTREQKWLMFIPYSVLLVYVLVWHPLQSGRVILRYLG